ncbi:DeoR/GlpR family DNA-binding transcription regulator [Bacteroides sp. 51]|uniref:DeoR/GlpR family DNA-binding transcription regulator n=1 Tax=Bacteroides sp. 51 TaxID=2302938 RepID=UPI0013D46FF4|nr:DeoR/GlpR family DNA-binding transcription regulator [Bacteroides sp. 51]NDV83871.1 DeoR/GlpR transcriptional regulator [Bacteroides sp. 51]
MLPHQRREKILELIREDGHAKVLDLSRIFKVTEVTIRQDLERLEKEGVIKREHGGAILTNMDAGVKNITLQNQKNMPEKMAIARKAVSFIENGDTIILDSGSTTTEIAKLLVDFQNITVITNALNIALILGAHPNINLVVTGGEFKAPTLSLTGQKAADFFYNLNVDKLFLATAGITLKSGLTYPSISDICVKRAMIESANEVYLVADSSKIGLNSFASLGALSLINLLITDSTISKENEEMLKANDIAYTIAQVE